MCVFVIGRWCMYAGYANDASSHSQLLNAKLYSHGDVQFTVANQSDAKSIISR